MTASARTLVCFALVVGCSGGNPAPLDVKPVARVCPTHLDMELVATDSRFDPGSTGIAHGIGLASGSQITVEITGCDDECRRCDYRGPVRGEGPISAQRCLNKVEQECAADADCGTSGPCCFVFPPISSHVVLPSCTLAYFEPVVGTETAPVQGVIDLLTGENDAAIMNIRFSVQLGSVTGAPDGACVNCLGDPQPFDGVAGGTCEFGGQACDVHGIGTGVASTTSYDCPPPPNGIDIGLPSNGTSTASRQWTLDDTRPFCTKNGAATTERCFCGVCTNGTPCIANKDCPGGTACGFAGSTMTPVNVANNKCTGTCNWDDATSLGTCSEDATIHCFPDGTAGATMVAHGAAEVHDGFYISQLANLVCMPSLNNGFLDPVIGVPGPFLFQARFRVTPRGAQ